MELLRDRSMEVEETGVRAVGISRDSPWSHVAWMQPLDLNFPLLSDWNAEAVRGFGIAHEFRDFEDVAHDNPQQLPLPIRADRIEIRRAAPERFESSKMLGD